MTKTLDQMVAEQAASSARIDVLLERTQTLTGQPATTRPDALARAEQAAKSALERFEKARAALYRPDGAPLFGEKELGERIEAFLEPVRAAKTDLLHATEAALEEAGKLDAQAKGSDPLDTLTADELVKASALDVFVAKDVSEMRLDALAERLDAIVQVGDKPTQYAYLRAATRRYSEATGMSTTVPVWVDGDKTGMTTRQAPLLSPAEREAVARIREALTTLRAAFTDPRATKAAASAKALRVRANAVRRWAYDAFGAADGSAAAAQAAQLEWSRGRF